MNEVQRTNKMTKKNSGKYVMRNEKKTTNLRRYSQHLMASLPKVYQATLRFLQVFKCNCNSCCKEEYVACFFYKLSVYGYG